MMSYRAYLVRNQCEDGYGSIPLRSSSIGGKRKADHWISRFILKTVFALLISASFLCAFFIVRAAVETTVEISKSTTKKASLYNSSNGKNLNFNVVASNQDYGEYSAHSRALYGFELLAEPYRKTKFEIVFDENALNAEDEQSTLLDSFKFIWSLELENLTEPVIENAESSYIEVILDSPGSNYILTVTVLDKSNSTSTLKLTVACRYVRRELRELTENDLNRFLDALKVMYSYDELTGRFLFGDNFTSSEHLVAMHNGNSYCYHDGLQFLTSHWGFNMVVERSLQAIDPVVSLGYWDFMIDSEKLGPKWYNSEVFSEGMFGAVMNDESEGFKLGQGRFRGLKNVYDPTGDSLVDATFLVARDAYGYINSPTNNQDEIFVSRTHSYCGVTGNVGLASCSDFTRCFDESSDLFGWESCMERQIHANMHGWFGGAWNCAVDFSQFASDNPEVSSQLLTFMLTYVTANRWPSNRYFEPYSKCPSVSSCQAGVTPRTECACSCSYEVDQASDEEIYVYMEELLKTMHRSYGGDDFIAFEDFPNEDETATEPNRRYVIKQGSAKLGAEVTYKLLRALLKLGCKPGYTGAMSTGASPSDPVFWILHPIYEKALHALTLSPKFEHYDFTWVGQTCPGSKESDTQPFSPLVLGIGEGPKFLANSELFQMATGQGAKSLSYVYDKFDSWGGCKWDTCPTCA